MPFANRLRPLSLVLSASAVLALGGSAAFLRVARGASSTAAMLDFQIEPSDATAGTTIADVKVFIEDSSGKLVKTATNLVTIAIGNNPGGGTLSGTTTIAAVKGQAVFKDLSIDKAGRGYTFVASAAGLTGATSAPFTIFAGPTTGLVLSGFPSPAFTGVPGTGTVRATDAFGNTTPAYRGTVTFTSSDPAASLPANHTFTDQDQGAFVFTATLRTLGTQSITATDTAQPSISGTQSGIQVRAVARFAYAIDSSRNAVSGYTVSDTNGQLRPNGEVGDLFVGALPGGSPHPISVARHPSGPFLYIANDGGFLTMDHVDPTTGYLTFNEGELISSSGDAITSIAIDPSGRFLYAAKHGVKNTIAVFKVDPTSGIFNQVGETTGTDPYSITVDPAGTFVYVTDSSPGDAVSVYAIGTDGTLTEISGSPFATGSGSDPRSLAIDPSGRFAYVANEGSGTVGAYTIDSSGGLAAISGSPFSAGQGVSSVVVDPSGRFVFATDTGSNEVSAYALDATSGALASVAGSPFPTAAGPLSATIDPSGRFLYVSSRTSNTISVHAIASTGALTPASTMTGGGEVAALVLTLGAPAVYTPAFAYAANGGSNDLSGYAIDAASGALSPISSATFAAGSGPTSLFLDVRGQRVYVTNGGSNDVWGYSIDATSGSPSALQDSPFAAGTSPASGAIDPTRRFAYVANAGSKDITSYEFDLFSGDLLNGSSVGAGATPVSLALSANGLFAYVATVGSDQVLAYPISTSGTLGTATAFATGTSPASVAIDPSTRFVYVANSGSGDVSGYSVDPNTGALTAVPGSPFAAGTGPRSVAVDPSGQFVYVANGGSGNVSAYAIDPTTGALSPVAGSPFAAGTTPVSVTVEPSGQFVYVANAGSSDVSAFAIGPGGALTPVSGAPFAAGTSPSSVTATAKIH